MDHTEQPHYVANIMHARRRPALLTKSIDVYKLQTVGREMESDALVMCFILYITVLV